MCIFYIHLPGHGVMSIHNSACRNTDYPLVNRIVIMGSYIVSQAEAHVHMHVHAVAYMHTYTHNLQYHKINY